MMRWFWFGWPRKYIVQFCDWKWGASETPEWILDRLYLSDSFVTFESDK